MPSSIYSAGFIAALTGLAQALPTASTPSIGDLTSASTSTVPELPQISSSTGSPSGSSFLGFAGSNELDLGDGEELPELSSSIIAGSLQHLNANDENDNSDSNTDSGLSSGSSFMGFAGSSDLDLGDSEERPEFDSSFLLGSLQNLESNDREARSDSGSVPTSGTSFIGFAGSNDLDLGDEDELPEDESSLLLGSLQTANQDEEENN
ncbi:hypothetical protein BDW60DRAFT_175350 [Aspergillus nidulans var. acristatus]